MGQPNIDHSDSADYIIKGRRIVLRLAEIDDAELIVALRTDERRSRHLTPVSGDITSQVEWLKKYKDRERMRSEFYFVVEDEAGSPSGMVRIYDIDKDSFTWGSWVIKPAAPAYCAIESALMVYEFAFERLGLERCHFEVRKANERVWAFHERMGAIRVGSDEIQFFYELPVAVYRESRKRFEKFLPPGGNLMTGE